MGPKQLYYLHWFELRLSNILDYHLLMLPILKRMILLPKRSVPEKEWPVRQLINQHHSMYHLQQPISDHQKWHRSYRGYQSSPPQTKGAGLDQTYRSKPKNRYKELREAVQSHIQTGKDLKPWNGLFYQNAFLETQGWW